MRGPPHNRLGREGLATRLTSGQVETASTAPSERSTIGCELLSQLCWGDRHCIQSHYFLCAEALYPVHACDVSSATCVTVVGGNHVTCMRFQWAWQCHLCDCWGRQLYGWNVISAGVAVLPMLLLRGTTIIMTVMWFQWVWLLWGATIWHSCDFSGHSRDTYTTVLGAIMWSCDWCHLPDSF